MNWNSAAIDFASSASFHSGRRLFISASASAFASGFPTISFNAANYWVDVVFSSSLSIDIRPPTISAVQATGIGMQGATISWTTDEASDSQVEYGTSASYGSATTLGTAPVTAHSQGLTGLQPATLYHYRVKSRDAAGNLAVADLTTAAIPGSPGYGIPNGILDNEDFFFYLSLFAAGC